MEKLDDETPEQLSPIEELDDDVQSPQPPRQSLEQGPPRPLQDEAPRRASNRSVDAGRNGLKEVAPGLSPLELGTDLLFSRQHLQCVLSDRVLSPKFITFLHTHRPDSVPILTYYLEAANALKALRYAESIIENLEAVHGQDFTTEISSATNAWVVEDKIARSLNVLVQEDMPAFIAHCCAEMSDRALRERVNGRHDSKSNSAPDALAEAFVLSDPASPDNPIVFTSEAFHSLTGYRRKDIIGHNCRVLGRDANNLLGRKRFRSSFDAEHEHCEVLLNYRRDGSPFLNLVTCVPLRDKSNRVRYYLGTQLVSPTHSFRR